MVSGLEKKMMGSDFQKHISKFHEEKF